MAFILGPRQDTFSDTYFEKTVGRSVAQDRMLGQALTSSALCGLAVSVTDEIAPKTIKNSLKAAGASWALAAAQSVYNAEDGIQKKDVAYSLAACQALMAGVCLWRGFKDIGED